MNLPRNLVLLPGVRQLHNGKQYVLGRYPSGKTVMVPYAATGAPQGYTVPLPQESRRPYQRKLITHTAADGTKQPVVHRPRRLHVAELRHRGEQEITKLVAHNERWSEVEQALLQPLVRLNGDKVAEILEPAAAWFHVQYHIDEEVK